MTERKRDFLTNEFRDGERPSGADFADLMDSFINKASDGVSMDIDGNLVLSRGVKLGKHFVKRFLEGEVPVLVIGAHDANLPIVIVTGPTPTPPRGRSRS